MFHGQVSNSFAGGPPDVEDKPINMTTKRPLSPSSACSDDLRNDADMTQVQVTSAVVSMLNALKHQRCLPVTPFGFPMNQQQSEQLADFERLLAAQMHAPMPTPNDGAPHAARMSHSHSHAGASYTISSLLADAGRAESHVEAKRRRLAHDMQPSLTSAATAQQSPNEHDDNNNGNRDAMSSSPSSSASVSASASPSSSNVHEMQEAMFRARLQALAKQNEVLCDKFRTGVERPTPCLAFPMPAFPTYPPFHVAPTGIEREGKLQLQNELQHEQRGVPQTCSNGALNQLANELKKEFISKLTDFVDDLVSKIELHKPAVSNGPVADQLAKQELLSALRSRLSSIGVPDTFDEHASASASNSNSNSTLNKMPTASRSSHRPQQHPHPAPYMFANAPAVPMPLAPPFGSLDSLTSQLLQLAQTSSASPPSADLFKPANHLAAASSRAQQPSADDCAKFMPGTQLQLGGYLSAKRKRTKVTDTRIAARHSVLQQPPVSTSALRAKPLPVLGSSFDLPTFYRNAHAHLANLGMRNAHAHAHNALNEHGHLLQNGLNGLNAHDHGACSVSPSSSTEHAFAIAQQKMDRFSPDAAAPGDDALSNSDDEKVAALAQNEHADAGYQRSLEHTSVLTPLHLRKAKLMFFYARYPSSSILKVYFPDVKFNKNNTAQLVKWFSNFREFYYIQMEKYARQAIARGVRNAEELVVTTDCELYNILNLHYNRNNQIDVPEAFRAAVETTLREFFKAISVSKDQEPSWKKAIYKIIARLDQQVPEFFKCPDWYSQLSGHNLNANAMSVDCV